MGQALQRATGYVLAVLAVGVATTLLKLFGTQFKLSYEQEISLDTVRARPGGVLVAVRDMNTLAHLDRVLGETDPEERDIVVVTVRLIQGPDAGERDLYDETAFTDYEQRLFTRVVALAEKHGKPVNLLVAPANNIYDAVVQTALQLDASEIVAGLSAKMSSTEQARNLGRARERHPGASRRQVRFRILGPRGAEESFYLGAHAPHLNDDDINLIHSIWLQVSKIPARQRVHHRDVVRVALDRLERDLRGQTDVMLDFYKIEHKSITNDESGDSSINRARGT